MVHKTFSFASEGFTCTVIINQSFPSKLTRPAETKSSEAVLPPLSETGAAGVGDNTRLAFGAFWADSVTLPAPVAFLSPALMTPTATACLMLQTAKRPRGGYIGRLSTHTGLSRTTSAMAASPDFRDFGPSSSCFPERRSIFSFSSADFQATGAV